MPVLAFLCPATRTYFDTGVRLDNGTAAGSRLNIVLVLCPECSREHRFLLADGRLDSSDSLASRNSRDEEDAQPFAIIGDGPDCSRERA